MTATSYALAEVPLTTERSPMSVALALQPNGIINRGFPLTGVLQEGDG